MTYSEALKLKSELPEKFTHQELLFTTCITPKNNEDFNRYSSACRLYKITDELAKNYSTNGEFSVRGICFYRDANLFYHIELPLK